MNKNAVSGSNNASGVCETCPPEDDPKCLIEVEFKVSSINPERKAGISTGESKPKKIERTYFWKSKEGEKTPKYIYVTDKSRINYKISGDCSYSTLFCTKASKLVLEGIREGQGNRPDKVTYMFNVERLEKKEDVIVYEYKTDEKCISNVTLSADGTIASNQSLGEGVVSNNSTNSLFRALFFLTHGYINGLPVNIEKFTVQECYKNGWDDDKDVFETTIIVLPNDYKVKSDLTLSFDRSKGKVGASVSGELTETVNGAEFGGKININDLVNFPLFKKLNGFIDTVSGFEQSITIKKKSTPLNWKIRPPIIKIFGEGSLGMSLKESVRIDRKNPEKGKSNSEEKDSSKKGQDDSGKASISRKAGIAFDPFIGGDISLNLYYLLTRIPIIYAIERLVLEDIGPKISSIPRKYDTPEMRAAELEITKRRFYDYLRPIYGKAYLVFKVYADLKGELAFIDNNINERGAEVEISTTVGAELLMGVQIQINVLIFTGGFRAAAKVHTSFTGTYKFYEKEASLHYDGMYIEIEGALEVDSGQSKLDQNPLLETKGKKRWDLFGNGYSDISTERPKDEAIFKQSL